MNESITEQTNSIEPGPDASAETGSFAFPASSGQRRLWFLEQLQKGESAYNIPVAFLLEGNLDENALVRTLQIIVQRHEVLRTRLTTKDSELVQVILSEQTVGIRRISADEDSLESALEIAGKEAKKPFDLSQGPLWRFTLIRVDESRAVFLATFHHCVFDGRSMEVFLEELNSCYAAYVADAVPELTDLPIQYADYTLWQQEWMESDAYTEQLAYWRERLAGGTTPLDLPTDRLRPAVQTYTGAKQTLAISPDLHTWLKEIARQQKSSVFMTLLAAFQVLLFRYSGQEQFYVGAPVANRTMNELEPLIGFLVNTLPIKADFSNPGTFTDVLTRVRESTLEALARQEIPFEKLVDELDIERDVTRNPIFQAMLQLSPEYALDLPALSATPLIVDQGAAQLDLALHLWERDAGLRGFIEYNTDLFDASTIERLSDHLIRFLQGTSEDPNRPIEEIPLLSPDEKRQILTEWNATENAYDLDRCLHHAFEEQAATTPDAVALVFEGEQLTYRDLNERTNRLAHFLRLEGVGPDVHVGVSMERSLEMVIALYAILKAGGAYVPIDPAYPSERIAFLLEDAGIDILLSQSHLAELFSAFDGSVVYLDSEWNERIADQPAEKPNPVASPNNLAYIIYTSGSTGKPKGVMIEHRAIVNRLLWMQEAYSLDETDCVLQKTPFSFDVSVWEFFWPLQVGAKLVIARPEGHKDTGYLTEIISSEGVTTMHFVPSMLQLFVEAEGVEGCASLRKVICSGEALSIAHQERFFERLDAELHNLYGPTEAAVDVTYWRCRPREKLRSVPIGQPIANIKLYVLDRLMHPVPIGVAGELHIGGVGLARGYLNRPELTAEKFVADPFDNTPGARLYKTGDLVRYLPDGNIEYLGRLDFQVKVRGFRIELGEIEEALKKHSDVQESTVIVREDMPGDKRLTAYLVAEAGISIEGLRRFLGERLPEYMVPSAFVTLEKMPLTLNGKLDRRALPAPELQRSSLSNEFQPPSTHVEKELAGIWEQVLRLDRVGVRDNFFELGGDSILAIQITSKANQAGIHLAPHQIFKHKTIAELALAADVREVETVEEGPAAGEAPLTPIQHWFFDQNFAEPDHWNMAISLDVNAAVDSELLEEAFTVVCAHHDTFRLRFDGVRQWYADSDGFELSSIDLSDQADEAIEEALLTLQRDMNLEEGPLFRAGLIDFGSKRSRQLILVAHHLVMDGVSLRILVEDLETVYGQLAQSELPRLPARTTSFGKWAKKLADYAQSQSLQSEMSYWSVPERMRIDRLPVDNTSAINTVASILTHSVYLTHEETRVLLKDVPEVYHTQMNDVLLTALVEAFAAWTGNRTLLVDLEGHGREPIGEAVDVSRTIGWFTSLYPVLLSLEGILEPGESLKSIKEQLRQIPNRGIGYGLLRYCADREENREQLAGVPRAEVMFNYLGQVTGNRTPESHFTWKEGFLDAVRSPDNTRYHLLEVSGTIIEDRLRVDWIYNKEMFPSITIEELAGKYIASLQAITMHCMDPKAGGYTPSDFPDVNLDQSALDNLLSKL